MRTIYPVILLLVCSIPTAVQAQNDAAHENEPALAPVHKLFDGMRAGDSTMVRDAFDPLARLVTTSNTDGKPAHSVTSIDDFVALVGTPHEEVWDERIWDIKVDVRDNLASVWMKYAFFRDDTFSHCGVNSFELFNTDAGWKVLHLADTRQREHCEMPPDDM